MATSEPAVMLDTSAWVAILADEPAAEELTALPTRGELLITPFAIAELASRGERGRFPGAEVTGAVLERARLVDPTLDDHVEGGRLHGRLRTTGNAKVGLGDCLIYATARRLGATLVTCDADLAKEPGVRVVGRKGKRARP